VPLISPGSTSVESGGSPTTTTTNVSPRRLVHVDPAGSRRLSAPTWGVRTNANTRHSDMQTVRELALLWLEPHSSTESSRGWISGTWERRGIEGETNDFGSPYWPCCFKNPPESGSPVDVGTVPERSTKGVEAQATALNEVGRLASSH